MSLLKQYRQGHSLILKAIQGLSEQQMKTIAETGRWTIHENVIHIVDADLVYSERIKRIIAEEEAVLLPFDQDLWTQRLDYHQRDLATYLELFRLIRLTTADLLDTMGEENLGKNGIKDGSAVTVKQLVETLVNHVQVHVKAIERIRKQLDI